MMRMCIWEMKEIKRSDDREYYTENTLYNETETTKRIVEFSLASVGPG